MATCWREGSAAWRRAVGDFRHGAPRAHSLERPRPCRLRGEAFRRYHNAWADMWVVPDDVPQVPIDEQAVIADWRRNEPRIIDVMQNPGELLAVRGFAGFEDELRPWRMTDDRERPWN